MSGLSKPTYLKLQLTPILQALYPLAEHWSPFKTLYKLFIYIIFTDHLPPWEYSLCKGQALSILLTWSYSSKNSTWHMVVS